VALAVAASTWPPQGLVVWKVAAMSLVTEHLKQQGAAFEVLVHRQAYTSIEEARALGVDADEVLKTLVVRSGPGYVLVVIPAARRLDLRLVREAVGDHHARLATEDDLGRDFLDYQLGALPPLGALVSANVYVDPEVLGHDTVLFAAGTQTESIKMQTQELFEEGGFTTVTLVKQRERGSDDRSRKAGEAVQQRSARDPRQRGLAQAVEDAARRAMAGSTTPGLAVALIGNGGVAWAAGYGVADHGTGRPVTTETRFQAASVSKPVTAWVCSGWWSAAGSAWTSRSSAACEAGARRRHFSTLTGSPCVGYSATPPACRCTATSARAPSGRCHPSRPRWRGKRATASRSSLWRHPAGAGCTRVAATA
jgi:Ala-tRNA(Pro) deacylase